MTAKEDVRKERKAADRKARLAEELRANLQKRKVQARSRQKEASGGKGRIANSE
jgi:hypothetical protein